MAKVNLIRNKISIIGIFILFMVIGLFIYIKFSKPSSDSFEAPTRSWDSPKKVENYFIEFLHMTPKEAVEIREKSGVDGKIDLRINTNVTLDALIGNLYYYGFIKDQNSFRYALTHTKDITPSDNAIKVGLTGTVDKNAEYRISETMDAWQIADILLNKPTGHFEFDEYNYFFMP